MNRSNDARAGAPDARWTTLRVKEGGRRTVAHSDGAAKAIELVWGWIYAGSENVAVYQARLIIEDAEQGAGLLLTWADGPYTRDPSNRRSAAIVAYCADGRGHFLLVDANQEPWTALGSAPGRLMRRDEALQSEHERIIGQLLLEILRQDTRLHVHFGPGIRGPRHPHVQ